MHIPSFSSPVRLSNSILNTNLWNTSIGAHPFMWGIKLALDVSCFPAIQAQSYFKVISKEQDVKEVLQSRKWVLITLSLTSVYILAESGKLQEKFPFIKFNPIEALVSPFTFLHKYYCHSLGYEFEATALASFKIWFTASIPLIYCEAEALYTELRSVDIKSDNFLTQSASIAAMKLAPLAIDFFISFYFSIESVYSGLFNLPDQSDSLINYRAMKSIFNKSPLLGKILSTHTLAVFLSHFSISIAFLLRRIFEKLQLVTDLENWRDNLPENSKVNTGKVFTNTLKTICGFSLDSNLLDLSNCNLKEVPPVVWKLKCLCELDLSDNQLESLPPEIAGLELLELLQLSGNSSLMELPESIRELRRLTDIFATNTNISPNQIGRLLEEIRWRRTAELSAGLSEAIKKWKKLAEIKDSSLAFTESLKDHEKGIVADWLKRLEQTAEFKKGNRPGLARVVCNILKSLKTDISFKKDFFIYIEVNNTRCEDRAAMSLNEIYVLWVISNLEKSKKVSLADKVEIYLRAVKTYTFRYFISDWIHKNKPNSPESVEIFLFYDNLLKNKLELLSPVATMEYSGIGYYLDELPEEKVIEDVEKNYLKNIFKYPAFEALIENDPAFNRIWESTLLHLRGEMDKLDGVWAKRKVGISNKAELAREEGLYIKKSKTLLTRYKEAKKESALVWLKQKGFIYSVTL